MKNFHEAVMFVVQSIDTTGRLVSDLVAINETALSSISVAEKTFLNDSVGFHSSFLPSKSHFPDFR